MRSARGRSVVNIISVIRSEPFAAVCRLRLDTGSTYGIMRKSQLGDNG
jgi:hypothetical protein